MNGHGPPMPGIGRGLLCGCRPLGYPRRRRLAKASLTLLLVGSFPAPGRADFFHLQPAVAVGCPPVRPLAAVKGKHDKPVCAYQVYAGIGFVYALFLVQKSY